MAALNKAHYEWTHHAPLLVQAGEISDAAVEYIRSAPPYHASIGGRTQRGSADGRGRNGETHTQVQMKHAISSAGAEEGANMSTGQAPVDDEHGLDEKHLAVLAYTDRMTLDVTVPEEVYSRLRRQFSDREVVEITATVAAYNCVSRFLVALDVGEMNGGGEGERRND